MPPHSRWVEPNKRTGRDERWLQAMCVLGLALGALLALAIIANLFAGAYALFQWVGGCVV
jgi:hypothetical protein